jgi:hypothetical protein
LLGKDDPGNKGRGTLLMQPATLKAMGEKGEFQALSDTKMNQAKVYGTGTSLKAFSFNINNI